MKNFLPHSLAATAVAAVAFVMLADSAFAVDPVDVRVVQPTRGDVSRFVTLPGNIRANQQATLFAKVPGYLKSVAVDRGDRVSAGQRLAEIEAPELEADLSRYAADLVRAKAEASTTKTEVDRLTQAVKSAPDLVVPQAFDAAKGRLATAEAGVTSAEAGLQRTKMLLGYAGLAAPFPGIVTARFADPGAFIPAATSGSSAGNAAILTLMDFSTVRVQIAMPEVEASLVRTGQPVRITVDGLPGKMFSGTVSRHGYALDEATRSLLCEADLPNPDLLLRPGMYASAKVGVETHTNVFTLPTTAIVMEKTAAFAFVADAGKVRKTPLTLGFNDGSKVEVIGGLPPGASVAIPVKGALADGAAINPVEVK